MKKVFLTVLIILFVSFILNAGETTDAEEKVKDAITSANNDFNNSLFKNALDKYLDILKYYTNNKNADMINAFSYQAGVCYYYLADYKNAVKYLLSTVDYYKKSENINDYINLSNYINYSYWFLRDYKNYIKIGEEIISLYKKLDNKEGIASALINIAGGYYALGDYKKAKEIYDSILKVSAEVKNESHLAYIYNGLGNIYRIYGKFDLALEVFTESIKLSEKYKINYITIMSLIEIGNLYFIWGNYTLADEYYKSAYKFITETDLGYFLPSIYDKIARIYFIKKEYFSAIEYFRNSVKYAEEFNKPEEVVSGLNSIGAVYYEWKKQDEALKYFNDALFYSIKNDLKSELGRIYIHIGNSYYISGDYKKSEMSYKQGLEITRKMNNLVDSAVCLGNLGSLYLVLKKYPLAVKCFEEAVRIKEELRKTAKGTLRRDYLSSQINSFYSLTVSYLYENKVKNAFYAMERGRTKYLIEEMSKKNIYKEDDSIANDDYLKKMKEDEALISFADISSDYLAEFVVLKNDLSYNIIVKDKFNVEIEKKIFTVMKNDFEERRGLKKISDNLASLSIDKTAGGNNFEVLINYFKTLLSKRDRSIYENDELKNLSKKLYDILFSDIEEKFKNKKTLIIIPDSVLAYLPFEALIMPDGRYLVEKYDIKYIQSTAVRKLIEKRKYSPGRKSVIAFGGASYGKEVDAKNPGILIQGIEQEIEDQASLENSYSRLGLNWADIPGTKEEVNRIKEIFRDAELYTGKDVNEKVIKDLSVSDKLSYYKIVHFATHGIVTPEEPELSALVLSSSFSENEDNYLSTKEITGLKLEADFVNLSACDTGLGKIYGGEGVAGLTQAFLIAGANALSVSLWQVADISTMEFMSGFYKIIASGETEYSFALNKMKRDFIKNERYNDPFYWACFVYYGK